MIERPQKNVVGAVVAGSKSKKKSSGNQKVTEKYKLRQQSYYLDEELITAIEMRLFANKMNGIEDEKDKSALVRAALSKYLGPELKQIKEKQQG